VTCAVEITKKMHGTGMVIFVVCQERVQLYLTVLLSRE
jgi:hypothetical protein